ncbi:hypothetical protein [Candidatus Enterococcus murrayae]|uniref:Uncharacterized protein n=1 Tax=Candidatus Enterococcus murrayae TaxID=2815321 RepID=A0ABS3HBX1_9ENTE|nr:hypothetical protein [Enterococcus sp. MJM16]MBO0450949.1 hypothetical protein [Enterococcus sp. MJM16]
MKNKQNLIIKYRFRPFIMLLLIVFLLFLGFLTAGMYVGQEWFMFLIMLLITFFMVWGILAQLVVVKKDFHIKITRQSNAMEVDIGRLTKKIKVVDLTKIHGVALQVQTIKSTTTYIVQLATDPKTWGMFYQKKEQLIQKYMDEYEEMYIVFNIMNQKDEDIQQLIECLIDYGIELIPFTPSVLGSYPGVPKKNSSKYTISTEKVILGSVERKMQIKQWISYFLTILIVSYLLLSLIFRVLGTFHGIYW